MNDFKERPKNPLCAHMNYLTGKDTFENTGDNYCKLCGMKYAEYVYRQEQEKTPNFKLLISLCQHKYQDGSDARKVFRGVQTCDICKQILSFEKGYLK
jgi:hypothetical protein